MTFFSQRRQAGDTIVEVLISIGVVSLVLAGAFLVASNSTKGVQDNHERTEAQQHLQSRVEALRSMPAADVAALGADNLCLDDSGQYVTFLDVDNPENCADIEIGGASGVSTIKKEGDLFTFTIVWDSIKGGKAREQFIYRYYAS